MAADLLAFFKGFVVLAGVMLLFVAADAVKAFLANRDQRQNEKSRRLWRRSRTKSSQYRKEFVFLDTVDEEEEEEEEGDDETAEERLVREAMENEEEHFMADEYKSDDQVRHRSRQNEYV